MDALRHREAVSIMKELLKHPLARCFLYITDMFDENTSVPSLIDLHAIKQKLKGREYQTFDEWLADIESVWTNVETYSNNALLSSIATDCRKIFSKIRRNFSISTLSHWRKEVYRLRTRVYDLMGQPPARVKQYAASLGAANTMKQNMPPFTEKEIHAFLASAELMTPEDNSEMLKIIDEMQPEMDPGTMEIFLDVSKINVQTIYALREYMKQALEKRGEKYQD